MFSRVCFSFHLHEIRIIKIEKASEMQQQLNLLIKKIVVNPTHILIYLDYNCLPFLQANKILIVVIGERTGTSSQCLL
jgi:hypothetical protein